MPLVGLHLRTDLAEALDRAGLRYVRDLEGKRGQDLNWLPGLGSSQLRKLHGWLVERDALLPPTLDEVLTLRPPPPPPGTRAAARTPERPPRTREPALPSRANPKRFTTSRIWIRATHRDLKFDDVPLSLRLSSMLHGSGIHRFGDLDGSSVVDLTRLRGLGHVVLRELRNLLVAKDALDTPHLDDPAAARRLAALHLLYARPLRNALVERAPPQTELRFQPIGIRRNARGFRLDALPMTRPLRRAVLAGGRAVLGELHGLTFHEACGGRTAPPREAMRQLHGLLRIAGVLEAAPLNLQVPARVRDVSIDDVPMPNMLRNALRQRGVRRLGQLESLTPARLGARFGQQRWEALKALCQRSAASSLT
jgi:hypothetical protein